MDIKELKGNSFLKKPGNEEPKKEITKVTQGTIRRKEKPLLAKMFGETAKDIGSYVFNDVLIPSIKEIITDIINNGLEMMLYGSQARTSRGGGRNKLGSYVSYNSIFSSGGRSRGAKRRSTGEAITRSASRHDFGDIVFDNRLDAEMVLTTMLEAIDLYESVTVAEFYNAVGLETEWNDHKFGWDNLATASVRRIREGYIINLPRPIALN